MVGRPRIREKIWEKVVERAEEEGMDPSEVIEDAIERFLDSSRRLVH